MAIRRRHLPPATLVRQPFLQQMTSTSVKIVWTTRELMSGAVQVRAGAAAPTTYHATSTLFTAAATGTAADFYQYVADVDGLQPSTTYTYALQMNGADVTNGADRFVTAPIPGSGTTRFIAFGDSGTGSAEQYVPWRRLMAADRFDLTMLPRRHRLRQRGGTGAATHTRYQAWFFDVYRDILRAKPVFPTIGNHDNAVGNGRAYRDVYVLSEEGAAATYPDHAERFYSFDYGRVHFVSLDTETAFLDTARRQVQVDWLKADLAARRSEWKVVYFHRPPYSSGFEHGSDLTIRNAFAPIFEQNGVQLVLSGHDHDYERTLPMKTSTRSVRQPVTYIVSGGGGAPTLYGEPRQLHRVRAVGSPLRPSRSDRVSADGAANRPRRRAVRNAHARSLRRAGAAAGRDRHLRAGCPAGNIVGADWSLVADSTAPTGFALKEVDRNRAQSHDPAGDAIDLRRDPVHGGSRRPLPVLVPHEGGEEPVHQRFRLRAVQHCHRREPTGDLSHRVDHGRVGDSRGQIRRGRFGVGMDRQLIWIAGGADLLRDAGAADAAHPVARRRRVDRPDSHQRRHLSDDCAGGDEKRRDQGSETVTVALG